MSIKAVDTADGKEEFTLNKIDLTDQPSMRRELQDHAIQARC